MCVLHWTGPHFHFVSHQSQPWDFPFEAVELKKEARKEGLTNSYCYDYMYGNSSTHYVFSCYRAKVNTLLCIALQQSIGEYFLLTVVEVSELS